MDDIALHLVTRVRVEQKLELQLAERKRKVVVHENDFLSLCAGICFYAQVSCWYIHVNSRSDKPS